MQRREEARYGGSFRPSRFFELPPYVDSGTSSVEKPCFLSEDRGGTFASRYCVGGVAPRRRVREAVLSTAWPLPGISTILPSMRHEVCACTCQPHRAS